MILCAGEFGTCEHLHYNGATLRNINSKSYCISRLSFTSCWQYTITLILCNEIPACIIYFSRQSHLTLPHTCSLSLSLSLSLSAVATLPMVLPDLLSFVPLGDCNILLCLAGSCRSLSCQWRPKVFHFPHQLGLSVVQCLCHLGCNRVNH